ncbi:ankyrin repeat domain-containing protein [Parapusillimonas sp. SGNA-6]|nr:ankyrin repeat domain-containing protein [Parapusillimonas sp. SGNA-6]
MAALPHFRLFFNRQAWLALQRSLVLLVSCLMLGAAAQAANPSDWWVNIANDRASQVRTMLARGANPNELSPKGQTALTHAIREGAWNVYDVLISNRKTDLNAVNFNRETPLMYLAILGETKRAENLIRRGAEVNRLGWTPLQYAASKGQLETVRMLVAHKALVNAPAPDGTTALMMAAYAGSEEVVRFLLRKGADPTMKNLNQRSAADWARVRNHGKLADSLDGAAQRVVAQREAARRRAQGGTTAGPTSGQGRGSAAPNTAGQAAPSKAPAAPGSAAATAPKSAAEPKSSTSRYFDLERFEKDPTP